MENFMKTIEWKLVKTPAIGMLVGVCVILVYVLLIAVLSIRIESLDAIGLLIFVLSLFYFIVGTGRQITENELAVIQGDEAYNKFLPFWEEQIREKQNMTILTFMKAFYKYKQSLKKINKNKVGLFLENVLSLNSDVETKSVKINDKEEIYEEAYKEFLICKEAYKEFLNYLCRYTLMIEEKMESNNIDEVKNILDYSFTRIIIRDVRHNKFKDYDYIKQYFDKHDKQKGFIDGK